MRITTPCDMVNEEIKGMKKQRESNKGHVNEQRDNIYIYIYIYIYI